MLKFKIINKITDWIYEMISAKLATNQYAIIK